MLVLALDTTTRAGSVAVVDDDALLSEIVGDPSRTHGERLPRDLMRALEAASVPLESIDLLAVAAGPGSFTGLRVGIAAMQGLAMASRPQDRADLGARRARAAGAGTAARRSPPGWTRSAARSSPRSTTPTGTRVAIEPTSLPRRSRRSRRWATRSGRLRALHRRRRRAIRGRIRERLGARDILDRRRWPASSAGSRASVRARRHPHAVVPITSDGRTRSSRARQGQDAPDDGGGAIIERISSDEDLDAVAALEADRSPTRGRARCSNASCAVRRRARLRRPAAGASRRGVLRLLARLRRTAHQHHRRRCRRLQAAGLATR